MGISTNKKHRDTFNEINITPLTDIFLVLLVIMMVIAPLLDQQGLKLIVPNYQEQTKEQKDSKIINISVSEDGKYTLDGKTIATADLLYAITEAYKSKKDGLLIQAKQDSTHGAVVKVMDIARNAGINSISVAEN